MTDILNLIFNSLTVGLFIHIGVCIVVVIVKYSGIEKPITPSFWLSVLIAFIMNLL